MTSETMLERKAPANLFYSVDAIVSEMLSYKKHLLN